MSIYNIVFRAADHLGMLDYVKPVARSVLIASRRVVGQDKRATKNHFKNSKKSKLHIGAGLYRIEGWLNSDYTPKPGVIVVDATKEFPFENSSFDYIYCEHMIEHITR